MHILCIFITSNVWYWWSLLILAIKRWFLFSFTKILQCCYFLVSETKILAFSRHFFWELPSKYCIVEFTAIQWNEVAASTARNFNNSWPLYLRFSNMINLCLNIWFIKNWKYQKILFCKRGCQKNLKLSIFLKGLHFVMGGPIDLNVGVFWETPVAFLKSVVL